MIFSKKSLDKAKVVWYNKYGAKVLINFKEESK